jgi:hypothetical protein
MKIGRYVRYRTYSEDISYDLLAEAGIMIYLHKSPINE